LSGEASGETGDDDSHGDSHDAHTREPERAED
jgi:hypothetical protein